MSFRRALGSQPPLRASSSVEGSATVGPEATTLGSSPATSETASVTTRAGWAAANALGFAAGDEPGQPEDAGRGRNHPWPLFAHPKGREFVDFDEDLQIRDITDAAVEGYDDIELLKRYSTVGMGPSQGRHSALATARLIAKATGRTVAETGVTTARPPFTAETLGVLAGRGFEPERLTAMHHRHLEAGAQMMTAGLWWRPAYSWR